MRSPKKQRTPIRDSFINVLGGQIVENVNSTEETEEYEVYELLRELQEEISCKS